MKKGRTSMDRCQEASTGNISELPLRFASLHISPSVLCQQGRDTDFKTGRHRYQIDFAFTLKMLRSSFPQAATGRGPAAHQLLAVS